jgi:hypothetical protein
MPTAAATLREIRDRCQGGIPLELDQSNFLYQALDKFLSHQCRSFEEALSLRCGRGGIPWWREDANRARDAALRELAGRYFGLESITARARAVHGLARRYAAAAWRFDRDVKSMPRQYLGTQREWLWRAFVSGAPMPIGERQLRTILTGGPTEGMTVVGEPSPKKAEDQS